PLQHDGHAALVGGLEQRNLAFDRPIERFAGNTIGIQFRHDGPLGVDAAMLAPSRRGGFQDASNSFSLSSRNLTSTGLVPGPPAKCPQIEGIGTQVAFGMLATSFWLSCGGK